MIGVKSFKKIKCLLFNHLKLNVETKKLNETKKVTQVKLMFMRRCRRGGGEHLDQTPGLRGLYGKPKKEVGHDATVNFDVFPHRCGETRAR